MDLAVILVQASWAAALAEPSTFLATARRVLQDDLARVRDEASKRGWLGPSLPSGLLLPSQCYLCFSPIFMASVCITAYEESTP